MNSRGYIMAEGVRAERMDHSSSEPAFLTCGVPQGSILGPLLFLIYINDLSVALSSLFPVLFADDTNLFLSHSDFSMLMTKANSDLINASRWFKLNKLSLNIKKSCFIIFTEKNKKYYKFKSCLSIGKNELTQVSSTTFLGVLIDERLSWKSHIRHVSNKISKSIGVISKVRYLVHQRCLATLYYSLIYPYLTYCNIIWGATCHTNLEKLFKLQKKFCRIATFSGWTDHSAPLFQQLNILSIYKINKYVTCIFIYKMLYQPVPLQLPCKNFFQFNSQVHNVNTRQANKLHLPKFRTEHCKFSIRYRGAVLWNDCGIVAESISLLMFKKRLRTSLMNQIGSL